MRRTSRGAPGRRRNSGFLGTGHYPIPVLETSMGLGSPETVIFQHNTDHIYGVLDLTFQSILFASSDVTDAAVASMKTRHYEAMMREREFSSAVLKTLRYLHPDIQLIPDKRVNDRADFGVVFQGGEIFVETRWRPGPTEEANRIGLTALMDNLPPGVSLLIAVDSDELPSRTVYQLIDSRLGSRGRILAWQEQNGAIELEDVFLGLAAGQGE
jgi:hypothetical protein